MNICCRFMWRWARRARARRQNVFMPASIDYVIAMDAYRFTGARTELS